MVFWMIFHEISRMSSVFGPFRAVFGAQVAPMDPDEAMLKLLREDKALRGLLQIEEQHIPGTEALETPLDPLIRRHLLKPMVFFLLKTYTIITEAV